MQKLTLTLLAGSALALGACGGNKAANTAAANNVTATNGMMATGTMSGNSMAAAPATGAGASAAAGAAWAADSRIVSENGQTYRIDANGTRTQLTASDSRIVTERGVRYRVDPDGTRYRIDERGLRIGDSVIRGNAPNGRSDVETPGEAATDAIEDGAEAIGDVVPD